MSGVQILNLGLKRCGCLWENTILEIQELINEEIYFKELLNIIEISSCAII